MAGMTLRDNNFPDI